MQAQAGIKVKPFGMEKLKIVDWMHSLLIFKDIGIGEIMAELQLPVLLLKLMQDHFMNSFLHLRVNKIFEEAFKLTNEGYFSAVRRWATSSSRLAATSPSTCCLWSRKPTRCSTERAKRNLPSPTCLLSPTSQPSFSSRPKALKSSRTI